MDDIEKISSNEEKSLARELDKCAFLYGEKFIEIAEPARSAAAARSTENTVKTEEKTERTRVHIDLGDSTATKLSPAPDNAGRTHNLTKGPKP